MAPLLVEAAAGEEELDLVVEERRVQELANAWAREAIAEVMKRADTDAPEVEIAGARWGTAVYKRGSIGRSSVR